MNKLSFYSVISFVVLFFSCNKKDNVTPQNNNSITQKICTECTATYNGTTTSPAQYCGTETEVKNYENNYVSQNQAVGATARCIRK